MEGLVQVLGLNRVEDGEPIKVRSSSTLGGAVVLKATREQDGECVWVAVVTIAALFAQ